MVEIWSISGLVLVPASRGDVERLKEKNRVKLERFPGHEKKRPLTLKPGHIVAPATSGQRSIPGSNKQTVNWSPSPVGVGQINSVFSGDLSSKNVVLRFTAGSPPDSGVAKNVFLIKSTTTENLPLSSRLPAPGKTQGITATASSCGRFSPGVLPIKIVHDKITPNQVPRESVFYTAPGPEQIMTAPFSSPPSSKFEINKKSYINKLLGVRKNHNTPRVRKPKPPANNWATPLAHPPEQITASSSPQTDGQKFQQASATPPSMQQASGPPPSKFELNKKRYINKVLGMRKIYNKPWHWAPVLSPAGATGPIAAAAASGASINTTAQNSPTTDSTLSLKIGAILSADQASKFWNEEEDAETSEPQQLVIESCVSVREESSQTPDDEENQLCGEEMQVRIISRQSLA